MATKSKGSAFEREISAKLSLWFSNNERDDIFYRTQSSGARFTARKKGNKDTAFQSGDITASDPIGTPLVEKLSIELKTGYGKWCILDKIDSHQKRTQLDKFWEQCYEDAKKSNREPILIFRRPLKMPCIAMRIEYFSRLEDYFGLFEYSLLSATTQENQKLIIISLKRFFQWANPQYWIDNIS